LKILFPNLEFNSKAVGISLVELNNWLPLIKLIAEAEDLLYEKFSRFT
jgi:hypothetical protein